MAGSRPRSVRTAFCALLILTIPHVAATIEWDPDPWLDQIVGPERIVAGDEFGCHGMPDRNIDDDPHDWVLACRDYVEARTPASRWSPDVVSFGARPSTDIRAGLEEQGVAVIGDLDAIETTPDGGVWSIGFDAGGLEKNVGSMVKVKQAAASGGMVHLHWQAVIDDINIRKDRELVSWLETSDAWRATWGEAWSYTVLRNRTVNLTIENSSIVLEVPGLIGENDSRLWAVPTTFAISTGSSQTASIRLNDLSVVQWNERPSLLESGWRIDGEEVIIALQPGDVAQLTLNGPVDHDEVSIRVPEWFDDRPWVLTVAGLHVWDLREWSSEFSDSPLRFTWLVEPRTEEESGPLLPCLAVITAVTVVIVAGLVLRRDRQSAARAMETWIEAE